MPAVRAPRFRVEHHGALWLLKLPRANDEWNHARVEAAMLDLAHAVGVEVPEHDVIDVAGRESLLVKRFDRLRSSGGALRHRAVSAQSVFTAAASSQQSQSCGSYPELALQLARWVDHVTANRQQLFRFATVWQSASRRQHAPRQKLLRSCPTSGPIY